MFALIKIALMLPIIPFIAINDMFNISIAENFPKTNIRLPNYKFNDLYDSFITKIPDYYNISDYNSDHQPNSFTSIVNDTNGFQLVSFDCPGFSKNDINITVSQNTLFINGSITKCMDSSQFLKSGNNSSTIEKCKLHAERYCSKTLELPLGIDTNDISAFINDGMVTIMYLMPIQPLPISINIQ